MIWLWVILCVAITAFLLRKKNIAPHNFLWALIPIERYGIVVAGVIIKPVYIMGFILVAFSIIRRDFRLRIPRPVFIMSGIFVLMIVLSMLFRGTADISSDISTYGMMFLNFVIAATSLSLIKGRDDLRQIKDVLIATGVGYGIVFIGLYTLYSFGIVLDGVTSTNVWDDSIFNLYKNVSNGTLSEAIRLRGFFLEPNVSNVCFILGYSSLLGNWIKGGNAVRNTIFALIMVSSVVLTSSRSSLIIIIFLTLIAIMRLFFSRVKSRRKIILISIILCVLFVGSIVFIYSSSMFSYVYDKLIARYLNRSALNDSVGRFTIWKNALSKLMESNWYAGIGSGGVVELTDASKDAHNTIIEVICTSGIFVGIYYVCFFVSPLIYSISRIIKDRRNAFNITTFVYSYMGLLALLTTISHIASIYLSFFAFLLYIIPSCLEEEDYRLNRLGKDGFIDKKI